MSKPLKVFHGNYNGRSHRMVAAKTKKEARELIGVSESTFRQFFTMVGDAFAPSSLALQEPGVVWTKSTKMGSAWERLTPRDESVPPTAQS